MLNVSLPMTIRPAIECVVLQLPVPRLQHVCGVHFLIDVALAIYLLPHGEMDAIPCIAQPLLGEVLPEGFESTMVLVPEPFHLLPTGNARVFGDRSRARALVSLS